MDYPKASSQMSSGELEYPPSILGSGTTVFRAQVKSDPTYTPAANPGAAGRQAPPALAGRPSIRFEIEEIGRAHVSPPVTHAHLVCRLLHETNNHITNYY